MTIKNDEIEKLVDALWSATFMGSTEITMKSPNTECQSCGGDGVDADVMGLFDMSIFRACPDCWPDEPAETQKAHTMTEPVTLTKALIEKKIKVSEKLLSEYEAEEKQAAFNTMLDALKPFAEEADEIENKLYTTVGDEHELWRISNVKKFTVGHLRKARAAIAFAEKVK